MSLVIDLGLAPTINQVGRGRHGSFLKGLQDRLASLEGEGIESNTHVFTKGHDHVIRIFVCKEGVGGCLIEFAVDTLARGEEFSAVGAIESVQSMASVGSGPGHMAIAWIKGQRCKRFLRNKGLVKPWSDLVEREDTHGSIALGSQAGDHARWALAVDFDKLLYGALYVSEDEDPSPRWLLTCGRSMSVEGVREAIDVAMVLPGSKGEDRFPEEIAIRTERGEAELIVHDPHDGKDLSSLDSMSISVIEGDVISGILCPNTFRSVAPKGRGYTETYLVSSSARLVKLGDLMAMPWAGNMNAPFFGWPAPMGV